LALANLQQSSLTLAACKIERLESPHLAPSVDSQVGGSSMPLGRDHRNELQPRLRTPSVPGWEPRNVGH
jgi:hypothetical protein